MKKILSILILSLFIFSLISVSAMKIDNVKKIPKSFTEGFDLPGKALAYNPIWAKYPPIEVKNAFDFPEILGGKRLFSIALEEHTEECIGSYCYSKGTFYTSGDDPVYDKMDFYTQQDDGSWVKQAVRSWSFKYWGSVDDYEYQCKDTKKLSVNGTAIQECSNVKVGSHEDWVRINAGEKLPEGTYDFFLESQKKPSRTVDWVMTTNGEELNELAVWGAIIGVGGVEASVTLNSPADSSTVYSANTLFNSSANVTNGASLVNMSYWNDDGGWSLKNSTTLTTSAVNESTSETWSGTGATTSKNGWKILAKSSQYVINITKHPACNPTTAYVLDSDKNVLATATFSSDTAVFSTPYKMTSGNIYYLATDEEGGSYTRIRTNPNPLYNLTGTYIDWIGGLFDGSDDVSATNIISAYVGGGLTSSTQTWNYTIPAGSTIWNVQACDSDGDCGFATSNFTVSLDATAPSISIDYPSGLINTLVEGQSLDLNYSISDTNLESCWYNYNGTNTTLSNCSANDSFTYAFGVNTLTLYANDSIGNVNSSTTTWSAKIIENSQTYSETTVEGSIESFIINLTVAEGIEISSATLEYNGDSESASISSSGTERILSVSNFEIPSQSVETNVSFYWSLTLDDASEINLTARNQTVTTINLDNCDSYSFQLFNITLLNEETLAEINGTVELYYEVLNVPNYNTIQNYSGKFEDISNTLVCSEANLSGQNLVYSTEIRYYADDYATELYHIVRGSLDEAETISLYDLALNDSTEFKVTYKNSNVVNVEGAVIQLQRKYISENLYRTVEAPITGSDGTAIVHIDLDTNKYRAVAVKNGEIVDIFENLVFDCENELSGICEQDLYADINSQNSIAIETLDDFSYGVSSSNGTVTITFSVPSGEPSTINIVLEQQDQFGEEYLCNKTVISSSGTVECTYNTTIGDSYLTLSISKDGVVKSIRSYIIPEAGAVDFLNNNFFIVFIFMLSIIGMAFTSPEWIVVNSVITMLLAGSLWLLNGLNFVMGLGGLMWLVVAAGILIMKISKQEDR